MTRLQALEPLADLPHPLYEDARRVYEVLLRLGQSITVWRSRQIPVMFILKAPRDLFGSKVTVWASQPDRWWMQVGSPPHAGFMAGGCTMTLLTYMLENALHTP